MIDSLEDLLAAARAHGLDLTAERPALDESGMDFLVAHAVDTLLASFEAGEDGESEPA